MYMFNNSKFVIWLPFFLLLCKYISVHCKNETFRLGSFYLKKRDMAIPAPSCHSKFTSLQPQTFLSFTQLITLLSQSNNPPSHQKVLVIRELMKTRCFKSHIILNIESTTLIKCYQCQDRVIHSFAYFTLKYKIWTSVSAHSQIINMAILVYVNFIFLQLYTHFLCYMVNVIRLTSIKKYYKNYKRAFSVVVIWFLAISKIQFGSLK